MTAGAALATAAILLTGLPAATAVELKPETVQAFDTYIRAAEVRLDKQRADAQFLWLDGTPGRKERVRKGEVLAEPWTGNGDIDVKDGLIHDWVGAVFIPGATLQKTLSFVQDYDNHKNVYRPEVIDSKLVSRNGNDFRIKLRLLKQKVITVVLNTDHEVHYAPVEGARCSSRSYSTRIAEVDNAGKSDERELPPGRDHGFLWRLNSYWRFEEREGGVYVECEAISLTRNVPSGLGWLINPIVRSLPRQSLANTLRSTRDALK